MLLTHPAASDAYSPLCFDAGGSQDMSSERTKKWCITVMRGREIVSPGLRAAAIKRVDVRGEHVGV
jgi:hypothetical protein